MIFSWLNIQEWLLFLFVQTTLILKFVYIVTYELFAQKLKMMQSIIFFLQIMGNSLLYEASFTRDCLQIYFSLSHCFNESETNGKLSVGEKHWWNRKRQYWSKLVLVVSFFLYIICLSITSILIWYF